MCLAEEGAVWKGSFFQIKGPVAGRQLPPQPDASVLSVPQGVFFCVTLYITKENDPDLSVCTFGPLPSPRTGLFCNHNGADIGPANAELATVEIVFEVNRLCTKYGTEVCVICTILKNKWKSDGGAKYNPMLPLFGGAKPTGIGI
ncbi:hypothetical protein L596_013401 [Steinernema carpocapsae]|uniref:Uncharacterized protein n=1 Tax=Steinernema carpocapsae TaxID=34508 RepID=A0A4U5P0I9_STECR|nr:hypothetical protein L596_013401 [Steinernema carpocapsae]